jgi:hypothetical protein
MCGTVQAGIFHVSPESCSQAESTPAQPPLHTVNKQGLRKSLGGPLLNKRHKKGELMESNKVGINFN